MRSGLVYLGNLLPAVATNRQHKYGEKCSIQDKCTVPYSRVCRFFTPTPNDEVSKVDVLNSSWQWKQQLTK